MYYEAIARTLGEFGRFQKMLYLMLGLIGIPCAMYNTSYFFWAGRPDFWCSVPGLDRIANLTHQDKRRISQPSVTSDPGNTLTNPCFFYLRNYTGLTLRMSREILAGNRSNPATTPCTAWSYDKSTYKSTQVTQWDLVCSRTWVLKASNDTYSSGKVIGACMLGYLSDRFGRRRVMALSLVLMLVTSIGIIFSPSYYFFLVFRFLWSSTSITVFLVSYIIGVEILGMRFRVLAGTFLLMMYAVGCMITSGIAFSIRDHFRLQLALSLPWIILVPYTWLIPESPRWCIVRGKRKDAQETVRRMAKFNEVGIRDDLLVMVMNNAGVEWNLWELIRAPEMRRKTLILLFIWFSHSLLYHTVVQQSPITDPYLGLFLLGLVEIPGILLGAVAMYKFGRRLSLCSAQAIVGTVMLLTISVPKDDYGTLVFMNRVAAIFATATSCIVWLYTTELMPTVVRTITLGAYVVVGYGAEILAGSVVQWEGKSSDTPLILCGTFSLVGALLSALLPDTTTCPLPEKIEDGEKVKGVRLPIPCLRRCWGESLDDDSDEDEDSIEEENIILASLKKISIKVTRPSITS